MDLFLLDTMCDQWVSHFIMTLKSSGGNKWWPCKQSLSVTHLLTQQHGKVLQAIMEEKQDMCFFSPAKQEVTNAQLSRGSLKGF